MKAFSLLSMRCLACGKATPPPLPPGSTSSPPLSAAAFAATRRRRRPDERLNRVFLLDAKDHLLEHAEDKHRINGDLQEVERHVCGDDELDWRAAKRYCHAPALGECGGTEKRTTAQERDYAVLR